MTRAIIGTNQTQTLLTNAHFNPAEHMSVQLLCNRLLTLAVAGFGMALFGARGSRLPLRNFAPGALSIQFSILMYSEALLRSSLNALDVALNVLAVLCMGMLLRSKSYSKTLWLESLLITAGGIAVTFDGNRDATSDSFDGLILLVLHLFFYSFSMQWQE